MINEVIKIDLFNDIQDLTAKLSEAINKMSKYGKELAEAERDYKITLRQEALKLRTQKDMPVTLIQQVVYGIPEVADKRFKRDVAESLRDTAREYINTLKLQIRTLNEQLSREWSNVK